MRARLSGRRGRPGVLHRLSSEAAEVALEAAADGVVGEEVEVITVVDAVVDAVGGVGVEGLAGVARSVLLAMLSTALGILEAGSRHHSYVGLVCLRISLRHVGTKGLSCIPSKTKRELVGQKRA